MQSTLRKVWASPAWRIGLGLAIGLILLLLAARAFDWQQTWLTLKSADLYMVLLAIFSVGLTITLKTARWQVLMSPRGENVGFRIALMALLTAQTINWFLPARVGDMSRVVVVGNSGPGKIFILGTIAIEKFFDMLSYGILLLYLFFLIPLPDWIANSAVSFLSITIIITVGLTILVAYPDIVVNIITRFTSWIPEKLRLRVIEWLQSGLASIDVLRGTRKLAIITFITACIWACALWTVHLAAQAIHLNIPLSASLTTLVFLQAGISLPSIPGRIGIFQYLCILALKIFDIDQSIALGFGILLQAIVLIPPTLISLPLFGILGLSNNRRDIFKPTNNLD